MKRILSGIFTIALLTGLFAYADADLGFKTHPQVPGPVEPAPYSDYQPIPQSRIDSTSKGIQLRFQDYPLGELLQNIQRETGIQFNLPPRMAAVPVSVTVTADNWESAVRKLIGDYSRVEVWTNQLQTTRVWLMEGAPYYQPSPNLHATGSRPQPIQSARKAFAPAPNRTASNRSPVSLQSLPPHILLDPGVLNYLQSKGIDLPEEIKLMYGPMLDGLPKDMPISPHILQDPMFRNYLESVGIAPPRA
ncbi:MAG: hypothetical protein IID18_02015 [Nitrospinae bacterium]|nr:hypothetical protein [Nitrospinota bacterium]